MENIPTVSEQSHSELSVIDLINQIKKVELIIQSVMVLGVDYGNIPGCGDKPTLLQPGAEKLSMTFRLAPSYDGDRDPIDLGDGHREYIIKTTLTNIRTGEIWAQGIGSCSTMETKYKYITEWITTGEPIPDDYKQRKDDYRKQGFRCGKENGEWVWQKKNKSEREDIADVYNTVLKIAKKRSFVCGIITATGSSSFVTQDLEDIKANENNVIDKPQSNNRKPDVKMPTENGLSEDRRTLRAMLLELCGGDTELAKTSLQNATKWETKSGKKIEGKKHIEDLSDKQVEFILPKIKKELNEFNNNPDKENTDA